jgi:5-methylcytosine-specific restriction endonuclease McrA
MTLESVRLVEKDLGKIVCGEGGKPRRKIPKHVKDTVWAKYIGADKAEGKCYVGCGRTIHITDFEVGHNKARTEGGTDNINNLRPICRSCNLSMGTISIEAFKRKYFSKPTTRKKIKQKGRKKKTETPMKRLTKQLEKDFF